MSGIETCPRCSGLREENGTQLYSDKQWATHLKNCESDHAAGLIGRTIDKPLERESPPESQPPSSLTVQHGGQHYKGMAIQPVEYALANNLDCLQFSVIKYVSRHKLKHGAEDLRKAIHFCQMALEMQYSVKSEVTYSDQ